MKSRRHISLGLGLVAVGLACAAQTGAAVAQTAYPERQITLIVPFGAGGPTDVVARLVAKHMEGTLGKPIVIENVGGAGGSTGMTRVATSAPDGYMIGVGNAGTQSAAPALYPNLKYDPATSFDQIGVLNHTPMMIVGKNTLEAKTLAQAITFFKANEAKLSQGHAGVGSTSHMAGIVFNAQVGVKPALVAYRGAAPAMNDLVAGQFDFMVDQALNIIPQAKAGTIKAFAVAAPARLESLPDVPTTKEAGIDFIASGWNAMVAPKGLPAPVREKLIDAMTKALADPAFKARMAELGSTIPTGAEFGPGGLQKLVESEVARMTPILKAAGVVGN